MSPKKKKSLLKRLLLIFGILFIVFIAAAIALPIIFKPQILELVKTEANKNLTAKVDFNNDIDISIFSSFPDLTVTVNDLSIIGTGDFEGDTLAGMKTLKATLDVMSVINGDQIEVEEITLDHAVVNAIVLRDGRANWDIVKPSTDTTQGTDEADTSASKFNLQLKKLEIINSNIVYDDQSIGVYTAIKSLNHKLSGDFTQDNFVLKTITDAAELTVGYEGINYLSRVKTNILADIDMDMVNSKFTFKENEVQINELFLGADGFVQLLENDAIGMDIKFDAKQTEFKNIISLIPAIFMKDFESLETSGKMALNGMLKGNVSETEMPAFNFNLNIKDGMFHYLDLPSAVNNVQVDLAVNNPDGVEDHTVVNLKQMHVELGKEPFDAKMLLTTSISDPNIDAVLKGKLDLTAIKNMIELDEGTELSGIINSNLAIKGKMSTLEKEDYENFNAEGDVTVENLIYKATDLAQDFNMSKGVLAFSPKQVSLSEFDAKIGSSDIQANGNLSNFFAFMLRDDVLKGDLNVNSNTFNANEFLTEEETPTTTEPTPSDSVALSVIEVPANIDFLMNLNINNLIYDNLSLKNVKGKAEVVDRAIKLMGVNVDVFKGSVKMDGEYNTKDPLRPLTDINFALQGIDIGESYSYMNTIQTLMPIAKHVTGTVNANFNYKSYLKEDMMPDLNSIFASGKLNIPNGVLSDFKPLNKIAETVKKDDWKKVVLDKINMSFKAEDGKIKFDTFDVKLPDGTKMRVGGFTGFDQTISYEAKTKLPRASFGAGNDALNNVLKQAKEKGVNLDAKEFVDVSLIIGGTIDKPIVKPVLGGFADLANNLKDQLKDELNKKKQQALDSINNLKKEAEDKAKAEAEKLRLEAEAKKKAAEDSIAAEKARLQAEADRKKKEAEEAARKKAEEEKKKKEEELKKKLFGK